MIALLRADGEGLDPLRQYGRELRAAAARARGGALPSVASLHASLGLPCPSRTMAAIDDVLRGAGERTPPVLKAGLAVLALSEAAGYDADSAFAGHASRLAALAVTLVLCVGGATTDAWLTLPHTARSRASLRETFAALAREARFAERGILAARNRIEADEERVRRALGRAAYSALDVLALLSERLRINVPETARALDLTPPTAGAAIARLQELGIAREITGKARAREFAYESIIGDLAVDTHTSA